MIKLTQYVVLFGRQDFRELENYLRNVNPQYNELSPFIQSLFIYD